MEIHVSDVTVNLKNKTAGTRKSVKDRFVGVRRHLHVPRRSFGPDLVVVRKKDLQELLEVVDRLRPLADE